MDMFMPSEIARLVLGYLKDMECVATIRIYLTENPHLCEYVSCLHQGREYPTSIAGKSLIDILQDYCHMRAIAERNPVEVCKLITRIEGNLAQVKYLAANGHMRSGSLTSSITNHTTAQKTSTRIMLMSSRKEKEGLLERRKQEALQISKHSHTASIGIQVNHYSPVTFDRFTQTDQCVLVDASTQCSDYLSSSSASPRNSSLCSSTMCPSTPICRPLESYSSPSSLVKSALMLNFGIEAFQTPNKERYLTEDGIWKSPRRKTQPPRKRLSYSPSPSAKKQKNGNSVVNESDSNENVDVTALIDELLHNTALHERIAANINNVVCNTSNTCNDTINVDKPLPQFEEPVPGELNGDICAFANVQEDQMPEAVIKTIVDRTECDPMFEAFLNIFLDKQDSNSRDSQFGLCSNDTPSPDTHGTPNPEIPPSTPVSFATTPSSDQLDPTSGNHYFNLDHHIPTSGSMAQNKDDDVQHPDSSGLATPTLNNDHVTDHQEHLIMSNGQTGETDRSNSSRKAIELTSSTLVSAISSTSTDSKKNKTVTNCASPSRQTETSNPRVQCLIQSAHLFKNADKLQPHVRVLDFGTPVKTNHSEGSKCNTSNVKKRHRGCEKEKKSRNKKQSVYHTKPVAHRKSVSLLNKPPTSTINKCATHENAHQSGIQQEYSNKNDHSVDQCNSRIQSGTNKLDIIAKDKPQSSYKSDPSQIALAVMNVEEFLSGLKYVE